MHDVYKNIEECNIGKNHKILIVCDDMIVYMINNKKLSSAVTELFISLKIKHFSWFYYTIIF